MRDILRASLKEVRHLQETIRKFLYFADFVRPNIDFTARELAKFLNNPSEYHFGYI